MSNDSSSVPAVSTVPPDDPAARPAGWHPVTAIVWVIVGFIASSFVAQGGVLLAYMLFGHHSAEQAIDVMNSSITAQFLSVGLTEAALVGTIYAFVRRRGGNMRDLGLRRPQAIDIPWALLGIVVYIVLYIVAVSIAVATLHIDTKGQQDLGFNDPIGTQALILTAISLIVFPPLAEEIVFRGFLFTSLLRRWNVWVAGLVTSVLFAIPHVLEGQGGKALWIAGIDTLILSVVLCTLRYKTKRIWAGVLIHMLKNSLAFAALYVFHWQ